MCVLVSYTLPHKAGDQLKDVYDGLHRAWKTMWSGRWADGFRTDCGMVGAVRAYETTYGDAGWHPHVHQVMFFEGLEGDMLGHQVDLWLRLHRRWADCVEKAIGRRPSAKHGVDVALVVDPQAVGEYVTDGGGWSIGAELTSGPVKITKSRTSLTPFELLGAAAVWGDADAAKLWWEYENATIGRHAIQASSGLYERYQVEHMADEEAVAPEAENVTAEVLIDPMDWVVMVDLHITDRFVMAVERWAVDGGSPPDPRQFILDELARRRSDREKGRGSASAPT